MPPYDAPPGPAVPEIFSKKVPAGKVVLPANTLVLTVTPPLLLVKLFRFRGWLLSMAAKPEMPPKLKLPKVISTLVAEAATMEGTDRSKLYRSSKKPTLTVRENEALGASSPRSLGARIAKLLLDAAKPSTAVATSVLMFMCFSLKK